MEVILSLTYFFFVLLLLALLVERIMEVLMAGWNYAEWRLNLHTFWDRRAGRLRRAYEQKARRYWLLPSLPFPEVARRLRPNLRDKTAVHNGMIPVISGDLVRHATVAVAARVVASALGILFCVVAGVDLVEIIRSELAAQAVAGAQTGGSWLANLLKFLPENLLAGSPKWLNLTLTGFVIGLGAEPVHGIITSLERGRKWRARKMETERAIAASVARGGN